MTVNIQFDTGFLSSEEAAGLTAFLGAVQPALLTAAALRESQQRLYGVQSAGLAGTTSLTPAPLGAADGSDQQSVKPEPAKPTRGTRKQKVGPRYFYHPESDSLEMTEDGSEPVNSDGMLTEIDKAKFDEIGAKLKADTSDEAQDAADEAAETASEQGEARTITTEDVKAAIGAYVAKFKLPATQEDGPGIFKSVLGAPPAGEPYWKLSILPQDQDSLAKCEKAWLDAAAKAERTKVS